MVVIAKANEGICKTLELGVSLSKGQYISVLASDDRYLPEKLEILLPVIESSDCAVSMVHSRNLLIDNDGSSAQVSYRRDEAMVPIRQSGDRIFDEILLFKTMPTLNGAVIKKEILIEVGSFSGEYKFEDFDLMLRLTRNHDILFVDCCTWEYRGGVPGSLGKNVQFLFLDTIKIFEKHLPLSKKSDSLVWRRYAYGRLYSRISESFYMQNLMKSARKWAFYSIIFNPFQFKPYRIIFPSLFGAKLIEIFRKIRRISKNP
jgi:glycosyltransferase involved in cell wall biosynthesis